MHLVPPAPGPDTNGHVLTYAPGPDWWRCVRCQATWTADDLHDADALPACPKADDLPRRPGEDAPHSRACGIVPHDHGPRCHANCPTCHGREFPQPIQVGQPGDPLPPGLSEAERLGLIVGAAYGGALADRDKARDLCVRLEQEAAEAARHIRALCEVVRRSSTWAHDTAVADSAERFLNALESPETPETPRMDR